MKYLCKNPMFSNSIQEFFDILKSDYRYDVLDFRTGKSVPNDLYKTLSAYDVIKYRAGCCWDYCCLEDFIFKTRFGIEDKLFYISADMDGETKTHTWLSYEMNDKIYAFEFSFLSIANIHEFNNYDEIFDFYLNHFFYGNYNNDPYIILQYFQPDSHLTSLQFMTHIYKTGSVIRNYKKYWNERI